MVYVVETSHVFVYLYHNGVSKSLAYHNRLIVCILVRVSSLWRKQCGVPCWSLVFADSVSTVIFCDISIIVCIFRIFMQTGSSH